MHFGFYLIVAGYIALIAELAYGFYLLAGLFL
jgi:hypothetical protein